ncbi:MAG: DUF2141 domain-containing protein [Gammaproteobacteria bacterium]|nr:DUF2141 domain-containing protein [Gammaproteobacteria bacterium]MCZ6854633.1 DUF2141 domain-containing protein [Gammaproteobacteria bacterium]
MLRRFCRVVRLVASLVFVTSVQADDLEIAVSQINSPEGHLLVQVLTEAAFKGEASASKSARLAAQTGTLSLTIDSLEPGEYAVRVMHDENDNGKLDSNLIGIPLEPWGFSNNAVGSFGPPGWKDVKFTLNGSHSVAIDLIH